MELKEVITSLGFDPEKIKTIDDFKASVDSTFTRNTLITEDSEPVKKIIGKTLGGLENHIKKAAKEFGVEVDFNSESVKSLGLTDKVKLVVSEVENKNKSIIDDLTSKVGQGNDEKVKDWEKKFNKVKKDKEDLEGLLNGTKTEYETYKQTTESKIKTATLNVLQKDHHAKIKFKPDATELEKIGFFANIKNKYTIDLEDEKIVPKDKNGNKIPSTKVVGTFKSYDELLEEEAIAGKVYALNQDGGKKKPEGLNLGNPAPSGLNGRKPMTVAPRMT